jgi:hypothetical protein
MTPIFDDIVKVVSITAVFSRVAILGDALTRNILG